MKKLFKGIAAALTLASLSAGAATEQVSILDTSSGSTTYEQMDVPVVFSLVTEGSVSMKFKLDEDGSIEKSLGSINVYANSLHAGLQSVVSSYDPQSGAAAIASKTVAECQDFITFDAAELPEVSSCDLVFDGTDEYVTIHQDSELILTYYTGPAANYEIMVNNALHLNQAPVTGSLEASQVIAPEGISHTVSFPHSFRVADLFADADNGAIGGAHSAEIIQLGFQHEPIL